MRRFIDYCASWRGSRISAWIMASIMLLAALRGDWALALCALSGMCGWMLAMELERRDAP